MEEVKTKMPMPMPFRSYLISLSEHQLKALRDFFKQTHVLLAYTEGNLTHEQRLVGLVLTELYREKLAGYFSTPDLINKFSVTAVESAALLVALKSQPTMKDDFNRVQLQQLANQLEQFIDRDTGRLL
jgi:hypothetical protein